MCVCLFTHLHTHIYSEDALGVSFSETIIATTLAVDNVVHHFPHNLYNGKKLQHSRSHGSFILLPQLELLIICSFDVLISFQK